MKQTETAKNERSTVRNEKICTQGKHQEANKGNNQDELMREETEADS